MNTPEASICEKIKIFFVASFALVPISLIELLHFFPFLACYYIDHAMNQQDLIIILLIFNIPKLLFALRGYQMIFICNCKNNGECFLDIIAGLSMFFSYVTAPLVPNMFYMYGEANSKSYIPLPLISRDQREARLISGKQFHGIFANGWCSSLASFYWVMIVYLYLSYGLSATYCVWKVGWTNLSQIVKISIYTIGLLVLIISLTFPKAFFCMKRNGLTMKPH